MVACRREPAHGAAGSRPAARSSSNVSNSGASLMTQTPGPAHRLGRARPDRPIPRRRRPALAVPPAIEPQESPRLVIPFVNHVGVRLGAG